MPRLSTVYDAIPTSQTVPFQIPSGSRIELIVWQDTASESVKLVKCDLCGRFMPLQGQSMSTSSFKRHRDSAGCKALAEQHRNQPSWLTLDFIKFFQGPGELELELLLTTFYVYQIVIGSRNLIFFNYATHRLPDLDTP